MVKTGCRNVFPSCYTPKPKEAQRLTPVCRPVIIGQELYIGRRAIVIKRNQVFFNRLNILLDTVLAFSTMLLAYLIRFEYVPNAFISLPLSYYVGLAVFSAALHLLVYSLSGIYRLVRIHATRMVLARILLSELTCMFITISTLYVFKLVDISRWTIVINFGLQCLLMGSKQIVKRLVLQDIRRKGYNLKHIVLIGSGETAHNFQQTMHDHADYGFHFSGYIAPKPDWPEMNYLGNYEALSATLRKTNPDEAIIAIPAGDYGRMEHIIHACEQSGTHLKIIPCYDKYISSKMDVENIEGVNLLEIRQIPLEHVLNAFLKRAIDIVLSMLVLIVTSPILLIAGLGVKLTSPGPMIFKQDRVGKNKRIFQMYKFRSMHCNQTEDTGWSGTVDCRRTAFGSVLRKYSIDELPQFVNVLKGDMSIVGPRPEVPFYVEQYRDEIPLYMIKHFVKPGITGWAQVNGLRGDTSIKRRIELDIHYIENWSLAFDVEIMFLTVFRLRNEEKLAKDAADPTA